MIVPLRSAGAGEISEWTAIELQGNLSQSDGAEQVDGRTIGALTVSEDVS